MGFKYSLEELEDAKAFDASEDEGLKATNAEQFFTQTKQKHWSESLADTLGAPIKFVSKNIIGAPVRLIGSFGADIVRWVKQTAELIKEWPEKAKVIKWGRINTTFGSMWTTDTMQDIGQLATDAVDTFLMAYNPMTPWAWDVISKAVKPKTIKEGIKLVKNVAWGTIKKAAVDTATGALGGFAGEYSDSRDLYKSLNSALIGGVVGWTLSVAWQALDVVTKIGANVAAKKIAAKQMVEAKPLLEIHNAIGTYQPPKIINWQKIDSFAIKRGMENSAYDTILKSIDDESWDVLDETGKVLFNGRVDSLDKMAKLNKVTQQRFGNTVDNLTIEANRKWITLWWEALGLDKNDLEDIAVSVRASNKALPSDVNKTTEARFINEIVKELNNWTALPSDVQTFIKIISDDKMYNTISANDNLKRAIDKFTDWFNTTIDNFASTEFGWAPGTFLNTRDMQSAMIETDKAIQALYKIQELQLNETNLNKLSNSQIENKLSEILDTIYWVWVGVASPSRKVISISRSIVDSLRKGTFSADELIEQAYWTLGTRTNQLQEWVQNVLKKSEKTQQLSTRDKMKSKISKSSNIKLEPVIKPTKADIEAERAEIAMRDISKAEREAQRAKEFEAWFVKAAQGDVNTPTKPKSANNPNTLNALYSKFTKKQLSSERTSLLKKLVKLRDNPGRDAILIEETEAKIKAVESLLKNRKK